MHGTMSLKFKVRIFIQNGAKGKSTLFYSVPIWVYSHYVSQTHTEVLKQWRPSTANKAETASHQKQRLFQCYLEVLLWSCRHNATTVCCWLLVVSLGDWDFRLASLKTTNWTTSLPITDLQSDKLTDCLTDNWPLQRDKLTVKPTDNWPTKRQTDWQAYR